MIISLTDTLEEEDVHINDWLVEQNLAEHGKMVCMKKRNFPFQYYLECQKRFKQYKFSNSREMETNSENKTLYNLNFDESLSHNNNSKKINNNKENSYNELILYKEKSKKSQSLEYNHSCKNDFSNEKINSFTINSEKKNTKKIESLYELLNLKIKSIHSKINNNNHINKIKERGNERYLESSFILSNPIVKKLYEKSDNTKSNISSVVKNIKNDISDTDTLSLSVKTKENSDMSDDISLITLSAKKTKNNDVSDTDTESIALSVRNRKNNDVVINNKYDILQKHNNIPKQYAYHFDVHTSEDELDFNDIRKSIGTCNEVYKTEYTDWSVIDKKQEKKYSQENVFKIPHKTSFRKKNIPIAENCFIKAVYNSSYSTLNDKDTQWTPAGNINKMSDVSPLIIKNIEKRKKNISNNMTVIIPQKILETLTDEKFSEKLPNISKNIEEIQSINLSQEIDNVNNLKYTNNNDTFHNTNFKTHSEDYKQNHYICMKAIPKRKLLEKLLSLKDTSNDILNIDSDDLSTSQESILSEYNNDNNNDKYTKEVYKNDINNEDISNESRSKIHPKCLPYSVKVDMTDLYTQESFKSMNNDSDLYKKELSETSSKSLFASNTELIEYVPSDSILSQQTTLAKEFNLIKKYNSPEKPLLDMEIKKSEQLLKEESILNEKITQTQISSKELVSKSFTTSNLDVNEEEIPVTSSKSSELVNNLELVEYVPSDSTVLQKITLIEEFDLIKKYNSVEKLLEKKESEILKEKVILNEKIKQIEISSVRESTPESFVTNNLDENEEKTPVTSPVKSSEFVNNLELMEYVSSDSTLSQQITLTEESDLIKKCNSVEKLLDVEKKESKESLKEKSILSEEITQTQTSFIKELVPSEISNIPILNDIDIDSDEEEWDVQVSYADVCNLLKKPFNENNQNQFDHKEFNSHLKIEEINDSESIEDTSNTKIYEDTKANHEVMYSDNQDSNKITDIQIYKDAESDTHEIIYATDKIANQDKTKNVTNQCIKYETQMPIIDSEVTSELNNKYTFNLNNTISCKLQGKAKTLVEMLNKAKLMQKDC